MRLLDFLYTRIYEYRWLNSNVYRFNYHLCHNIYIKLCMVHVGGQIRVFLSLTPSFIFRTFLRMHVRWQEVALSYVRMAHGGNETLKHSFSIYYITVHFLAYGNRGFPKIPYETHIFLVLFPIVH